MTCITCKTSITTGIFCAACEAAVVAQMEARPALVIGTKKGSRGKR